MSLWLDTVGEPLTPRAALEGDVSVDVAIVGGGFTGLRTALELAVADPSVRVAVLEAEIAGFGASGRNGGWASAYFAASQGAIAKSYGESAAVAMRQAMVDAVDDIGAMCARERIDCHFRKGGTLVFSTSPAHDERVRGGMDHEPDARWLEPEAASARLRAAGTRGARYSPHCAAIHPARLARGLAAAAERHGVTLYEQTRASAIEPGRITTDRGTVHADVVVRATEGYTPKLRGLRRRVAPVYSLMVATEPLPEPFWDEVGWQAAETFTDGRILIIYGQRTADGRIAFGGRGAPYHFGSRVRPEFDREPAVFDELERILRGLFPGMGGAQITHRWGGPLAIPRDSFPSVGIDRSTGMAWGGGYVGDGVTTANLAGRTLADLILERETALTSLPWVNHHSRSWEPEPLRWLGINAGLRVAAAADRREAKTGERATRHEKVMSRLLG